MYTGNQNYVLANLGQTLPHNYVNPANPTTHINPRMVNMTWLNVTSGEIFTCMDNTPNANVWEGDTGNIIMYSSPSLLLPLDVDFNDNSTNTKTITNSGSTLDTTHKKFGIASAYFNGTSQYFQTPAHADFEFGSDDFTISCWLRVVSTSSDQVIFSYGWESGRYVPFIIYFSTVSSQITIYSSHNGTSWDIIAGDLSTDAIDLDTWYFFEFSRKVNTFNIFLNGILHDQLTSSLSLVSGTYPLTFGATTSNYYKGYIDDIYILKGVCLHLSDYYINNKTLTDG